MPKFDQNKKYWLIFPNGRTIARKFESQPHLNCYIVNPIFEARYTRYPIVGFEQYKDVWFSIVEIDEFNSTIVLEEVNKSNIGNLGPQVFWHGTVEIDTDVK